MRRPRDCLGLDLGQGIPAFFPLQISVIQDRLGPRLGFRVSEGVDVAQDLALPGLNGAFASRGHGLSGPFVGVDYLVQVFQLLCGDRRLPGQSLQGIYGRVQVITHPGLANGDGMAHRAVKLGLTSQPVPLLVIGYPVEPGVAGQALQLGGVLCRAQALGVQLFQRVAQGGLGSRRHPLPHINPPVPEGGGAFPGELLLATALPEPAILG